MRLTHKYFLLFFIITMFFSQSFPYSDVHFYSSKPQQTHSASSLRHQLLPYEVYKYRQKNGIQQKNTHKKKSNKKKFKTILKDQSAIQPTDNNPRHHRPIVQEIFSQTYDELGKVIQEYSSTRVLYNSYSPRHQYHITNRIDAYKHIQNQGVIYHEKNYFLDAQAASTLAYPGYTNNAYATLYGNQLQHTIHQEIIECLKNNSAYRDHSPLYAYKQSITDCIEAARLYNLNGQTVQAFPILDFCWTLMDYGYAIGEGVANGIKGVITDSINHPVETALCAVAGKYVLAYQLTKVLFNVAEIGGTYLADPKAGKDKWDLYIEPLSTVIDALFDKQITVRDCIKGGAQLATHWKAQSLLLGGLHNFYRTIKDKAIAFARRYPLAAPQEYMQTADGMILKITHKSINGPDLYKRLHKIQKKYKSNDNQKKSIPTKSSMIPNEKLEWSPHGFKHKPRANLSWKEIIKSTQHGDAMYKPGINIQELELHAWSHGQQVSIPGKNYKVFKHNKIVGANSGKETCYMRVECNTNTIHGHPILESSYLRYLK